MRLPRAPGHVGFGRGDFWASFATARWIPVFGKRLGLGVGVRAVFENFHPLKQERMAHVFIVHSGLFPPTTMPYTTTKDRVFPAVVVFP